MASKSSNVKNSKSIDKKISDLETSINSEIKRIDGQFEKTENNILTAVLMGEEISKIQKEEKERLYTLREDIVKYTLEIISIVVGILALIISIMFLVINRENLSMELRGFYAAIVVFFIIIFTIFVSLWIIKNFRRTIQR